MVDKDKRGGLSVIKLYLKGQVNLPIIDVLPSSIIMDPHPSITPMSSSKLTSTETISVLTTLFSINNKELVESWQIKSAQIGLLDSVCSALLDCNSTPINIMDTHSTWQLPIISGIGGWSIRKKLDSKLHWNTNLIPLLHLLASLTSHSDFARSQILSKSSLLSSIVVWLNSTHLELRGAACSVVRSLSRSLKGLRTGLWDAGVADALLKLIVDAYNLDNVQVLGIAVAALCNIVLEFSRMKTVRFGW